MANDPSLANILGPWIDPNWDSGLVNRCKSAWNKPIQTLTNEELATLLRQRFAIEHLLPIAKGRLETSFDDDTEIYEGELRAAINYASQSS